MKPEDKSREAIRRKEENRKEEKRRARETKSF